MLSSNVNIVRTVYGESGDIYPVFNAPVLFAARVLRYANDGERFREVTAIITRHAAEVADLVTRIGGPEAYYDFCVHDGKQNLLLRMRFVENEAIATAYIDFFQTPIPRRGDHH